MKSSIRRALRAAIPPVVCAAIAAACNSSSPVEIAPQHLMPSATTFAVSPLAVDLGTTATTASVIVKNTGSQSLTWSATEDSGWLSMSPMSGTIAAKSQKTVTFTVRRGGKPPGVYSRKVKFTAGTAGSAAVLVSMTVPATSSSTVLLAGQIVNQFTGSAMSGLTVRYAGKSATTNSSGMFTIAGSPTTSLQELTLSGTGVHSRVTFARSGDNHWRVVPSSFSMQAFNDVARDEYGSSTIRWTGRPTIYVDSRPEGFTSAELGTWISQVKVQAADFVTKWTGAAISPASVIVTSSPPSDLTPGTIVIHFSEKDSRYGNNSSFIGYARFSSTSSGSISSGSVWLRYLRYSGTTGASKRKGILGHELGHIMGYAHMTSGTLSFMEPSLGTKTDLTSFDHLAASLLYSRSPHNRSADIDSGNTFSGSLTPSGFAVHEWVCGDE